MFNETVRPKIKIFIIVKVVFRQYNILIERLIKPKSQIKISKFTFKTYKFTVVTNIYILLTVNRQRDDTANQYENT